jgi:hypothetical protein
MPQQRALDYEPVRRNPPPFWRRNLLMDDDPSFAMKRLTKIIIVILAAACIAVSVPIGGRKIVGFNYRAAVDTEYTVCPDWVVGQSRDVITLTTGEKFRVRGVQPEELTSMLLRSNAYVKVDRAHHWLSIRKPGAACGMRPEQNQWITIPLHATERVQTYYAEEVAEVEPAGGSK